MTYPTDLGGLPPQSALMTGRAIFTEAYAVIPKGVMRDIVSSPLPNWDKTRSWTIARPLSGFAETFAHLIMEVAPGGGSQKPEPDRMAEGVLFVVGGALRLTVEAGAAKASLGFTATQASGFDGIDQVLEAGGYAYLPAGCDWALANEGEESATFHWIRKAYEAVDGIDAPKPFVTSDQEQPINWMPDTEERWGTTRFVDPDDLAHDMHVNIVTFEPGGSIPFEETHVMEHGLYVLEGKAVYKLNQDWVEVEAGDFMWLRAFCPQACYAGGPGRFRYLLYKDMNRLPRLGRPGAFLR
ncbi:MAG: bifunctional allantoicase/(S)-ureidoglycine aminohydrolase [Hyphomicrobiales bacterium]|jgi:(S)-ureidoglycine aminohydrolase